MHKEVSLPVYGASLAAICRLCYNNDVIFDRWYWVLVAICRLCYNNDVIFDMVVLGGIFISRAKCCAMVRQKLKNGFNALLFTAGGSGQASLLFTLILAKTRWVSGEKLQYVNKQC